eukprot:10509194-Ditylum_brightwellii.AAC.1
MLVGIREELALEHGGNQGETPMAMGHTMFGAQCCALKLHGGKCQCQFIVLPNDGVDGLLCLGGT